MYISYHSWMANFLSYAVGRCQAMPRKFVWWFKLSLIFNVNCKNFSKSTNCYKCIIHENVKCIWRSVDGYHHDDFVLRIIHLALYDENPLSSIDWCFVGVAECHQPRNFNSIRWWIWNTERKTWMEQREARMKLNAKDNSKQWYWRREFGIVCGERVLCNQIYSPPQTHLFGPFTSALFCRWLFICLSHFFEYNVTFWKLHSSFFFVIRRMSFIHTFVHALYLRIFWHS